MLGLLRLLGWVCCGFGGCWVAGVAGLAGLLELLELLDLLGCWGCCSCWACWVVEVEFYTKVNTVCLKHNIYFMKKKLVSVCSLCKTRLKNKIQIIKTNT